MSRELFTVGQARRLARLAAEIAVTPPARRNPYAVSATVPWQLIELLRAELEAAAFDWRAARRNYLELLEAAERLPAEPERAP